MRALSLACVTGATGCAKPVPMILLTFAAAVLAPLIPPQIARDLRCVAIIGTAANPAWAKDGAHYTAIVGANAMDATGQTRESVRDLILQQVKIVRANKVSATETSDCVSQMRARIALESVVAENQPS